MIHAGDTIENPVTGERLVFHKTSAETNGEAVVVECIDRTEPLRRRTSTPTRRSGSRSSAAPSASGSAARSSSPALASV